jgi:putative glutamine amidotransferase
VAVTKRVLIPYREESRVKSYVNAAVAAGLDPDPLAVNGSLSMDGYLGLLLTGGTDVNPQRYGEHQQPETEKPDDERDECELALLDQALARDLPILAICRGHQLLNVYHGGTLIQHLPSGRHAIGTPDKGTPAHEVLVEPDTLLASITGVGALRVNSRHHQAVDRMGAGLRASAKDPGDGTIEALERSDRRFVLAVQWHPEDQVFSYPEQMKLFQAFADAL